MDDLDDRLVALSGQLRDDDPVPRFELDQRARRVRRRRRTRLGGIASVGLVVILVSIASLRDRNQPRQVRVISPTTVTTARPFDHPFPCHPNICSSKSRSRTGICTSSVRSLTTPSRDARRPPLTPRPCKRGQIREASWQRSDRTRPDSRNRKHLPSDVEQRHHSRRPCRPVQRACLQRPRGHGL